jgi:Fur family transcriptional regulator, iron response regulator
VYAPRQLSEDWLAQSRSEAACPTLLARNELKRVRLRATRQRVVIGALLFSGGHRHLTAEMLYREAVHAGLRASLTTIYNTLRQFSAAGLVREVLVPGHATQFDTNLAHHQHFLIDGEHLIDAAPSSIEEPAVSTLPDGYEVERVEVVVRLRRRRD